MDRDEDLSAPLSSWRVLSHHIIQCGRLQSIQCHRVNHKYIPYAFSEKSLFT